MRNPDPLKISYIIAQADENPESMSPFQGFGLSWPSTLWALPLLAIAPASLLERSWPMDGLISQRMGGASQLEWLPLAISALEYFELDDIAFNLVLFSGSDKVAERVEIWRAKQPRPTLHARLGTINSHAEAVAWCDTTLREHCRALIEQHGGELSQPRLESALHGLEHWLDRQPIPIELEQVGHNISAPNEMVLMRAGRTFPTGKGFIGESEAEYDAFAVGSARAVMEVRQQVGLRDFNRL